MFKLNEKCKIIRIFLKYDFVRFSPFKISTIDTAISQTYIFIPRNDIVISLLNSYLAVNFDTFYAATGNRYTDNIVVRLVNFGVIGFFSIYELTISSEKRLEDFWDTNIVFWSINW